MKRTFILAVLIFTVLALSLVSAKTIIAGKTYDMTKDPIETVSGAEVYVACDHSGTIYVKNTISLSDGTYALTFCEKTGDCPDGKRCDSGDFVIVNATKGGLYGEASGTVWDKSMLNISVNLAVVNVPMIPEFGLLVGMFTVLSAVVVFFVIRRK